MQQRKKGGNACRASHKAPGTDPKGLQDGGDKRAGCHAEDDSERDGIVNGGDRRHGKDGKGEEAVFGCPSIVVP